MLTTLAVSKMTASFFGRAKAVCRRWLCQAFPYVLPARVSVLFALAAAASVEASSLDFLEPSLLNPGDLLQQEITWQRDTDTRIEIMLVSAPDGAYLDVNDTGQLLLRWQTESNLPDESILSLQARDIDTLEVLDTRDLLVLNRQSMSTEALDDLALIAGQPVEQGQEETEQDQALSVTLRSPASQIVLVDQTVLVTFTAQSNDDRLPIVSIDRLPRDATFEENGEGGYTFFWQPRDVDQGVHTFRLTATHPENSRVRESDLFTVVVGDPSVSVTQPALPDE